MPKSIPIIPRLALVVSLGLFAVCLLDEGFYIEGQNTRAWAPAFSLLLVGWFGLGYGAVAWLANPALIAAWLLHLAKKPVLSLIAALAALALMLTFLFQETVVSSEAPTYSRIVGYGAGYWLWIASAVAQLIGSGVAAISDSGRN